MQLKESYVPFWEFNLAVIIRLLWNLVLYKGLVQNEMCYR